MAKFLSLLKKELIFTHIEAGDKLEALRVLAEQLRQSNYVQESFTEAIIERERNFPTGLETLGCGVAIPHTDVSHVRGDAVAIGVLKRAVPFRMMGMDDREVMVDVVFMLALSDSQAHLQLMTEVAELIQRPDSLRQIKEAADADEIMTIVAHGHVSDSYEGEVK